jgi:tRNA(adenine34) deaminase
MEIEPYGDEWFMREAIREAMRAKERDEVPVGSVLVSGTKIWSRGYNMTEALTDVTAHAEMQVITAGAHSLGSKYLNECTLYVTLEPCVMCAGALRWARVRRIVFGAYDTKYGFTSQLGLLEGYFSEVKGGVLEAECSELLKAYFASKRR